MFIGHINIVEFAGNSAVAEKGACFISGGLCPEAPVKNDAASGRKKIERFPEQIFLYSAGVKIVQFAGARGKREQREHEFVARENHRAGFRCEASCVKRLSCGDFSAGDWNAIRAASDMKAKKSRIFIPYIIGIRRYDIFMN